MPRQLAPASSPVRTLTLTPLALELIDQRVLPLRFEYLHAHDAHEVAQAITDMVVRGAPAIGCAAAAGVALEAGRLAQCGADFDAGLQKGFSVLAASRPTAVNLAWALARMRECWGSLRGAPPQRVADGLHQQARQLIEEDLAINQRLGEHGATLIGQGARILTHCNAGALATAGHGTALGVIRSAVAKGVGLSVVACETRPFLQGARLTAWELQQEGIPVTLIADSAAAHLMARGEIDLVIVGADRVARNGDTANKIGTYMHAVCAARHAIPFYVACPLSTLDANVADGSGIPIEERAGAEVTGFGEVRWAPEGIAVRNPSFDVTPSDLITAIITESGVLRGPYEPAIRALAGGSRD